MSTERSQHPVDKLFCQQLQGLEKQPCAQTWEKIQARLQTDGRRKALLWWASGIAASVSLLTGVYLLRPTSLAEAYLAQGRPSKVVVPQSGTSTPLLSDHQQQKYTNPSLSNNIERHQGKTNRENAQEQKSKLKLAANHLTPKSVELLQPKQDSLSKETLLTENLTQPIGLQEGINMKVHFQQQPPLVDLELIEDISPVAGQPKKQKRLGRILSQLKKIKQGEKVSLKELGVHKEAILVSIQEKFNTQRDEK
jgi:hypothetical protein